MNRVLKQGIVFLSLLALVSLLRLPYGSYKEELLPSLQNSFMPSNIGVDLSDIKLAFPFDWEISQLKLFLPSKPLPLQIFIDSTKSKLSLFSLIKLNPYFNAQTKAYGGSIQTELRYPLFSNFANGKLNTIDFPLESFPLAQGLGIVGKLSLDLETNFDKKNLNILSLENTKINLQLTDASYLGNNLYISAFKIPQISQLQLAAKAIINKQKLEISSVDLNCNLVQAKANGLLHLSKNFKIDYGNFNISLQLSEEGKEKLAGYLALISGTDLKQAGTNWQIEIELTAGSKPTIKVTPL